MKFTSSKYHTLEITAKKHLILAVTLFLPYLILSQQVISMDDFLYSANKEAAVKLEQNKIAILESGDLAYPLVERLELRTETNDFTLNRQEYAFRILTNSFKEVMLEGDVADIDVELAKIEKTILLKSARMNRYKIVLSQVFLKQKLNYQNNVLELHRQKMEILKQMANYDLPKINAIIDAETDLIELEYDIKTTKNQIEEIKRHVNNLYSSGDKTQSVELNTDDFLAANFIREHYNEILSNEPQINLKMQENDLKIEKGNIETLISRKRNNKLVKFYQFRYGGRENGFQQDQFSISVGLLIPQTKKKRIDRAKLNLDILDLQSDNQQEIRDFEEEKLSAVSDLSIDIMEYLMLKAHMENSVALKVLDAQSELPDLSALGIIALKEHAIKLESRVIESEFRMYNSYLESLDVFGMIEQEPFKNFLSYRAFGY